jgi:Fungal Zn(2)-Cys(6) binuclear cluster domain
MVSNPLPTSMLTRKDGPTVLTNQSEYSPISKGQKVQAACHQCTVLRLKCTETRPCASCRKRGIECTSKPLKPTACARCQIKKIRCNKERPCETCFKGQFQCHSETSEIPEYDSIRPPASEPSELPSHSPAALCAETMDLTKTGKIWMPCYSTLKPLRCSNGLCLTFHPLLRTSISVTSTRLHSTILIDPNYCMG